MALSENIKARRTQLKMSQEYVADQLGISRQAVAKWEAGTSEPTSKNLSELAFLFEISISELVDPGRWGGVILLNAGWDGYSSGLYGTDFPYPYHWLAILTVGLVLLFITSKDMGKKHRLEALQSIIGLAMIFSIFFLPRIIPLEQVGVRYLLADVVTAICGILLSLKYWRYIWKVK